MHINLFKHIGGPDKPQRAIHPNAQQVAPTSSPAPSPTPSSEPQDTVTLSSRAMKALRVDHNSNRQVAHARAHDNKINSLERWVDKAASKTEANDGKIPFGMEWKLNYVSTRIDKALNASVDENGKTINLTEAQQEKLIQINNKINNLLTPISTNEDAAIIEDTLGDSSALLPATEEATEEAVTAGDNETPIASAIPTDESETADSSAVTITPEAQPAVAATTTPEISPVIQVAEPETILDILEENQEVAAEETV